MRIGRHVRYHHPGWFPGTPKMQMYAFPRDQVLGLLAGAGLEVLSVEAGAHGAVENTVFIARRPPA
jgi:hypothetical protein